MTLDDGRTAINNLNRPESRWLWLLSPPVTNRSVLYVVPVRDDEIIAEKTTDDDFVGRCGARAFHFYEAAKSETAVWLRALRPWPLVGQSEQYQAVNKP